MRRAAAVIFLAGVSLWLTASAGRGQDRKAAPSQESEESAYAPPSARKSVEIGDYYFRRKAYKAALSRYQEAIRTDPYYPRAFLGLGKVYDKTGLKQKALDSYLRYLDLLPSEKTALDAEGVQRAVDRLRTELKQGAATRETTPRPAAPQAQ